MARGRGRPRRSRVRHRQPAEGRRRSGRPEHECHARLRRKIWVVVTPERITTERTGTVVLKFGGELLEDRIHLATVVAALGSIATVSPVVVVHGGGREIDAALKTAGLEKRQVDGLRITDEATLDVVVSVLAGAVNTRFVAALTAAGVGAVGLTGADGWCGLSDPAPPHQATDGRVVDLGRVGVPTAAADVRLLEILVAAGFVPVIACI